MHHWSADNPLFPFLFEFYDNLSASHPSHAEFGSRQEASARPILERTVPIPLHQRVILFVVSAWAACASLAAPRSTKKANSSLKLKWIFIDCFFTARLCNYLWKFSQQSHFYPHPCSFFPTPSFAQITQAVFWNPYLFFPHINYTRGAAWDKDNDFVYLISWACDAAACSG